MTSFLSLQSRLPSDIFSLFYDEKTNTHKQVETIVADGDGTLYHASSFSENPSVDASPVYPFILQWLEMGQMRKKDSSEKPRHILFLTTGGAFETTQKRFLEHIPAHLREGVLLCVNGGSALFYHDPAGKLHEDLNFRSQALPGGTTIDPIVTAEVVEMCVRTMNVFFTHLRTTPSMQERILQEDPAKYASLLATMRAKTTTFTQEELISDDHTCIPRIELRKVQGAVTQIALIGIPSFFPEINAKQTFEQAFPTLQCQQMTMTLDINVRGVDKKLALSYLGIHPGYSFGIGDSPHQNDFPLSTHSMILDGKEMQMPFVSVCKDQSKVPFPLHFLHLGNTVKAAAQLFQKLLDRAAISQDGASVIRDHLIHAVQDVRASFSSR